MDKSKVIANKDNVMAKAIGLRTGSVVTVLPTGHVTLVGGDTEAASALIDDLIDGDGVSALSELAEQLTLAAPKAVEKWAGEARVDIPEDLVGAMIGGAGSGLKV